MAELPTELSPAAFTNFGALLRFLRRRARLTQRELSIEVGYNFGQISWGCPLSVDSQISSTPC